MRFKIGVPGPTPKVALTSDSLTWRMSASRTDAAPWQIAIWRAQRKKKVLSEEAKGRFGGIPWGGRGREGGEGGGRGGGRARGAGGGAHARACVRACVHAPFDLPPIA
jgi:hypothetical protein